MNDPTDSLDRTLHAELARLTLGISPASLLLAWWDWAAHLAVQPARSSQLLWFTPWLKMLEAARGSPEPASDPISPPVSLEDRRRLADPAWNLPPFNMLKLAHETGQLWLRESTGQVRGAERHHLELVSFWARQMHAMASPANFPATNPLVITKTAMSGGWNLVKGWQNWSEDLQRLRLQNDGPEQASDFKPGVTVALTPGKVVFRNRLIELIQYSPATPTVHPEPVLVVSAWIMRYYILDLSPRNSLIAYLVGKGHTVFAVSWKNPGTEDRDLGMQDYLDLGLMASLDAIGTILPRRRIHALGYCLGGTLLAIGAAAMARDRDDRLATISLLAAQTDFSEPGEIGLFVDESQLSYLEDLMARQGCLESWQMAGAFALLRADNLIWSPMVRDYYLGERAPTNDLMAWNADGTRMPYRMHTDYLRRLFLDNALARGKFRVGGKPVSLADIRAPIFALGTRADHVAPWPSVYKINLLCETDIRFVLVEGGHNAGIVSEPGHPHRSYQVLQRAAGSPYVPPEAFLAEAAKQQGSWWPALDEWLASHSGPRTRPPPMGNARGGLAPLCDAPGSYVHSR